MPINVALIFYQIFRLRVRQGVLPVPSAAAVRDHRVSIRDAVWNEYKESKLVDRN